MIIKEWSGCGMEYIYVRKKNEKEINRMELSNLVWMF